MPTFEQILHNIKDHFEAALAILRDGQASGGAKDRLLAHIIVEEGGNMAMLQGMLAHASASQRPKIELAIEHSQLLIDILKGDEIAPALGLELLDHFHEEHVEGFLDPAETPAAASFGTGLTVGSLLGMPQ